MLPLPSTLHVIFHSLFISPWFCPRWHNLAEQCSCPPAVLLGTACSEGSCAFTAASPWAQLVGHSPAVWWRGGWARCGTENKKMSCELPAFCSTSENDFGAQGRRYHFNNLLIKWPRLPKLKSTLLLQYTRNLFSITPNISLHNYSKSNFILKLLLKPKYLSKSPCLKKAETTISLKVYIYYPCNNLHNQKP